MSVSTGEAPGGTSPEDRRWLAIWTALLSLASFVAAVVLGRDLFATGVQHEWNILFDADPVVYLRNFSTGTTIGEWGGRSFVHPNLTNLVYIPIRLIFGVLTWLPLDLGPPMQLRENLAFMVSPLIAAVRVPILVMLMRSLGLTVGWSLALVVLDTVSFSTRLFASIPESYMPAGTLLGLLFWMAARDVRSTRRPNLLAWGVVLTMLIGVSIVNVVAGSIMLAVALWRHHGRLHTVGLTLAVALAALGANAGAYELSRIQYSNAPDFHPMGTEHLEDSWRPRPARVIDFPVSLANAYFPMRPRLAAYYDISNAREFAFTFERLAPGFAAPDPRTLIFLALLALGIASHRWLPAPNRPLFWGSVLVLMFGAALHATFGRELVLYTQHWKAPVIVLIAGIFYVPGRAHRWLALGLPWLVVAIAISNGMHLLEMVLILTQT